MTLLRDRNLQLIIAALILAVLGGSLVGPILPAMTGPLDATDETIGLVLSVFTLCALLATPFAGPLADRYGRAMVLVPALFAFGTAGPLITFSESFLTVLVLRAIQGLAVGSIMNTGSTLIGDLFSGNERARAMGYRMSFQTLTNAIVPFIAGGLATLAWFYPFLIYSLALPIGILVALYLDTPQSERSMGLREYARSAGLIMRERRALWIFSSVFLAFVLLYVIVTYMPILVVRTLELTTLHAGLGITVASGVASIAASQTGKLMRAYRSALLVLIAFTFCGLSLLLLSSGPAYPIVLVFLSAWGFGFGLLMTVLNTEATGLAPTALRAGVLSVFTMLIYLGQSVSPPLFGIVLGAYSIQHVFLAASMLALLPIAWTAIEWKKERAA